MDTGLVIEPLTTTIAASVRGVDLARPLDPAQGASIRAALDRYAVLVFPGQDLTLDQQSAFATTFGPLEPLPSLKFLGRDATVTLDAPAGGTPANNAMAATRPWAEFQGWHTDSSFTEHVPRAAVLRAEVIPPVGGATTWTSMCAACEALSEGMRGWLETLRAVHHYPDGYKQSIGFDRFGQEMQRAFDEQFPPRPQPVVVAHPNGRRALFVNPAYTVAIEGLSLRESRTILSFLFDHVTRPDFTYRHRWRPGDIVVWDELATLHLAPDDFAPHPRRVVRVTAGLVKPEPVPAEARTATAG